MKRHSILLLMLIVSGIFISCNGTTKPEKENDSETEKVDVVEAPTYVHDTMIIVKVAETKLAETAHGVNVRNIYDNQHAQVMIIMLKPGESLKPHITPVDVFFYILEGTVDVTVGDKVKSVSSDCLIESPKDIKHNLSNNSDKIARIMVVKVPKPQSSSTIL